MEEDEFKFKYDCDECRLEETCECGCVYFRNMIDSTIEDSGISSAMEAIGYELVRNLDLTDEQEERFLRRLQESVTESGVISF